MKEHELDPFVDAFMSGDTGTRLLVGCTVKYLADKGLIDLNDYLNFMEDMQNKVAAQRDDKLVVAQFELLLGDFRPPK